MILHLFPAEKFTKDYINRIYQLFNREDHIFIIYGKLKEEYRLNEITEKENVIFTKKLYNLGKRFKELIISSTKVICHSLFFNLLDLIMLNKVISKSQATLSWFIWGKDLYEDYDKSKSFKGILLVKPLMKEIVRKSLIKKVDIFITTGDYEVLQKRYKLKTGAKQMEAQYTYKLLKVINKEKNEKTNVMVGHSATETCRHIDTFQILKKYAGKIKVYCPLSYPQNDTYINKVSAIGKNIFGDDFIAMTNFMKYEEYVDFLNSMDIGVFNNNRQQGMGNITNLLYLGKKLYLSEDNTIRKSYCKPEYYIYDCKDIEESDFLIPLNKEQSTNNKNHIINKFSKENFYSEWRKIFDE